MEILAPAGSPEALERAQAAGADAVYLGYAAFSARAGAGNFDREQLEAAIRFAHLHQMRVYVTVNTLVKDGELIGVRELLALLRSLRADGVLVQDLGILRMIRRDFPGLRVHASTQMAIHNATGVRWCREMGMKRVVLARECSLAEIRKCAETGVEIEVFGHGAQCVSVSGECLFSSMVGERSGNRGRCAQPCRKRYRLDGAEGAWLSPRDLCLRNRLPELADAGAASLKIEGRLKRPEYVYTVSDSYVRAKRDLEAGCFRPASEAETERLRQMFDRGGFMEGYAFGTEDAGVIQPRSVNHQGIPIGTVTAVRGRLASVLLQRDLHDGDGLRIRHGAREAEMTYSGKETPAGQTATLRLREEMRAEPGDPVFRLTDARLRAEAMTAPRRKIPVEMELEAWPGRELTLKVSDGETEITVTGEPAAAARSRETAGEEMERCLRKTGGTDFEARRVQVRTGGAFVPVSLLNELRRNALEALAEKRISAFEERERTADRPEEPADAGNPAGDAEAAEDLPLPAWTVTVRNAAQAEAWRGEGIRIVWYPEDFREEALERLRRESLQPGDWLRLPEVCEEETLDMLWRWTAAAANRLGGIVLGSVGQLGRKWPVPIGAGPGVPVMNREAARLLKEAGCAFVTASPELTGEELRQLRAPGEGMPPVVLNVYGRTQLMLLHHCPARTALGCARGHGECALCDRGAPEALAGKSLEDERGYRFPLQRIRLPEGCRIRLLNALPTDLGDRRMEDPRGAEMTAESPEEAEAVRRALERNEKAPGPSTRGHWKREVL